MVPAQAGAQRVGRRVLTQFQIGFHRRVVLLERGVDQLGAERRDAGDVVQVFLDGQVELLGEIVGDLPDFPLGVLVVREPDIRLHLDQIDHATEVVFRAERDLDADRAGVQAGLDHADATLEVRARTIHLVDVADARHVVVVGQAPVRFRLRLHAGDAIEHHDRAVEHAERAVHLDGEVDVARGVDDVDLLSRQKVETAADWMVMPRFCSCSM